jgi:hypothetical protein
MSFLWGSRPETPLVPPSQRGVTHLPGNFGRQSNFRNVFKSAPVTRTPISYNLLTQRNSILTSKLLPQGNTIENVQYRLRIIAEILSILENKRAMYEGENSYQSILAALKERRAEGKVIVLNHDESRIPDFIYNADVVINEVFTSRSLAFPKTLNTVIRELKNRMAQSGGKQTRRSSRKNRKTRQRKSRR